MEKIESVAEALSKILWKKRVDWAALDDALLQLDDINAIDEKGEATILSALVDDASFEETGFFDRHFLPDLARHFLACGYDVRANGGKNGCLVLSKLILSSDRALLDAAKLLLDAGATTKYRFAQGENRSEPDVLEELSSESAYSWGPDQSYNRANLLEAYYAVVEAYEEGREYRSITSFYDCIGKMVTEVETLGSCSLDHTADSHTMMYFSDSLVLWFGEKPLVIDNGVCMVVNPEDIRQKTHSRHPAEKLRILLRGSHLIKVQYADACTCFLDFDNGFRLVVSNYYIDEKTIIGICEIRNTEPEPRLDAVRIGAVCKSYYKYYTDAVTNYHEQAVAVFDRDDAYLIYTDISGEEKHHFRILKCSKHTAIRFTQRFPLGTVRATELFRENGEVTAIRFECDAGFLYLKTSEYKEIDLKLSEERFDPNTRINLRSAQGIHMEFSPYDFKAGERTSK